MKVIKNFNEKNQYLLYERLGCIDRYIFQSYDTIMFEIDFDYSKSKNTMTIDYINKNESDYSQTTCKYLKLAIKYLAEYEDIKSENVRILNQLLEGNTKQNLLKYIVD